MNLAVTDENAAIDSLFSFPGVTAEDIITPAVAEGGKRSLLSQSDILADVTKALGDETEIEVETPKDPVDREKTDALINSVLSEASGEGDEDTEDAPEVATAKVGKSPLTSYIKNKIEAKEFSAFDDYDEKKETLDQYLNRQPEKVLHEILDANWAEKERELLEKTPQEFFEALPRELQYAAEYVMKGGTDMRAIFSALGKVEEVRALDVEDEGDQEQIARAYLQATGYGKGDKKRIEKQVNEWKEADKLAEKAAEFKPDLDEMQEKQVEYLVAEEAKRAQQEQQKAQVYVTKVREVLLTGEIGGLKLNKKEQADLYGGLTHLTHRTPDGTPTNELGYLFETTKDTNPELLTEVLMHLKDPKGFKERIGQSYKNTAVTEIARKLKGQQGIDSGAQDVEDEGSKPVNKKLKRRSILSGWG